MLEIHIAEFAVPSFVAREFNGPAGDVDFATQAAAEAGTSLDTMMSPGRTTNFLDSRRPTQAEAEAGADLDLIMSPGRTTNLLRHSNALATTALRGTVLLGDLAATTAGTAPSGSVVQAGALKQLIFSRQGTVANDTALPIIISAVSSSGFGAIVLSNVNFSALFVYDFISTPAIIPLSEGPSASLISFTTGILNGTTGTDGHLTLSVNVSPSGDNTIYIENRTGLPQALTFILLGAGP